MIEKINQKCDDLLLWVGEDNYSYIGRLIAVLTLGSITSIALIFILAFVLTEISGYLIIPIVLGIVFSLGCYIYNGTEDYKRRTDHEG